MHLRTETDGARSLIAEWVGRAQDALGEYGIDVAVERTGERLADVTLKRRRSTQTYSLSHLSSMTATHVTLLRIHDHGSLPVLAIGEHIASRSAERFRATGIQYIDLSGNAYVQFGDVLIDVRGRPKRDDAPRGATSGGMNLFSTKRAQVVFSLLSWPRLAARPVEAIANAAAVSTGQAHSTIKLLADAGYLSEGQHRELVRVDELANQWTAAYPFGLGQKLALGQFSGNPDSVEPAPGSPSLFLGGESAVRDLIRPTTLVLYTETLDARLALTNRWRTAEHPNIYVRRKFWHSPDAGTEGGSESGQLPTVPPLLVYADLMASNDPRLREAAGQVRDGSDGFRQVHH